MAAPENWSRKQSKEGDQIEYYWINGQNLAVAIKKSLNPVRPSKYNVILLDKKKYGGAQISNRRKRVGSGNNKEELRSDVVEWMRQYPEATRKDYESLQRKLRSN